ncbi:probable exonuclease mut-7 homolog at N-terminal half [Coccomyxa sp. Obi]|nr:probable exonuclease mut-7 homolog at N-terminal half [Coccomyxa sp. Obi]
MSHSDSDRTPTDFFRLPDDWNMLLIDDQNTFNKAWDIVEDAYVCALDAEWEPYTSKPSASLVQAAVRTRTNAQHHILLLDFEALPKPDLKRLLQRMFRDKAMLKVGYGLVMDLCAIAAGLGGEGAGCVSVVTPFIDIGSLHRDLYAKGTPGIAKVEGKGLAGLVEAQLGQRLDKRLQCSSWSKRPLHPDQIAYAALDAAVLLLLLDSFIAVAPPQPAPHADTEHPQQTGACSSEGNGAAAAVHSASENGSEHSRVFQGSEGSKTARSDGIRGQGGDQLHGSGSSGAEDIQAASQLADKLLRACSVTQGQHESSNIVTVSPKLAQGLQVSKHGRGQSELVSACEESSSKHAASVDATEGAEPGSAAEDAVRRAAAAWGTRLEVGGAPAKQRRDRRPGMKKLTAAEAPGEDFGWPAVIPWEASRGEPRFACDVMTEGLARQLRLCGLDATSAPEFGKNERFKAYRHLVTSAEEEGRVILTADTTFLRARYSDRGYLVRATNKREQLAEVLNAFNIKVEEDDLLSRCTRCNGTFIPRPLTSGELPATCGISESVQAKHSEFWMCSNKSCQKVYWQGFQYGNAMQNLTHRILGSFA